MAEFTLDTSGEVLQAERPRTTTGGTAALGLSFPVRWPDLDPFTQGYIEAMFATMVADTHTTGWAFRYLAPETLAAILRDCAARLRLYHAEHHRDAGELGKAFWRNRQEGHHETFPPQAPYLGDDGKVYLREGIA